VSETLHVVKMTVSEPNREQDRATEEAIQALQSQLADLRMLVRAARASGHTAGTKPHRDRATR
jgi:hypothetical protein